MSKEKELPKYKSHKEVSAAKIAAIVTGDKKVEAHLIVMINGVATNFLARQNYMDKHKPKVGGYYVKYEDGYESFSPAEAFESGYTLISDTDFKTRLIDERNQLADKIKKLGDFLTKQLFISDSVSGISEAQSDLLSIQHGIMIAYLNVLIVRINRL